MRKQFIVCFLTITFCLLAISNGIAKEGTPKRGGTLTISQWAEPQHLNPMWLKSDIPLARVASNVFEPMVDWDFETQKLIPVLATEWYQKDPKTWVFKLRKGVQFHKGYGEFTAEDVAFTVNYIVKTPAPVKFMFAFVKSAEVIDKYTVQYNLERPHTPFILTSASGVAGMIVSKKAFEEKGKEVFNRDPVGTGPFEFEKWVPGSQLSFKRFNKYWDTGKPYIDKLVWKTIPEVFTSQSMLIAGELDFVPNINYRDIKTLKKKKNLEIQSIPGANWDFITFDSAKPPFNKKEVRQAVAYAIDRNAIVQAVYYGWADADDDALPEGYLGDDPDIQVYPNSANIEKAKELLKKAGYPNGFKTSILTSDKEHLRRETQIIAEQLKKVGIQAKIEQSDMATYVKRVRYASDFEVEMEDIGIMSSDPDSSFWWFHHSGMTRIHGHENPKLDKLLEDARVESDPSKRAKLYQEIIKIVSEEAAYIYIAHVSKVHVYNKALKGYKITPSAAELKFKNAWLDR